MFDTVWNYEAEPASITFGLQQTHFTEVHFWNLKKYVTKNTIFSPDIRFDGRKTVLHTPWTSGLYKV